MKDHEKQLADSLKGMMSALENYSSNDDVAKVFETLVEVMKEMKAHFDGSLSQVDKNMRTEMESQMENIMASMELMKSKVEENMSRMTSKDEMAKSMKMVMAECKQMMSMMDEIKANIPAPFDHTKMEADMLRKMEEMLPENLKPKEVRDMLENLPESDRLTVDAIHNLRGEWDRLEKKIGKAKSITIFGGGLSSSAAE